MDSRADLPVLDSPTVLKVPAWARPRGEMHQDVDAAYLAGSALNSLDALVRRETIWAGAWRNRLALKSAVAAARLVGRKEETNALRDAHVFRSTSDDAGPAGNMLLAFRRLANRSPGLDETAVRPVAEQLGIRWDAMLTDVLANAEDLTASPRPAPLVAAELAAELYRVRPDAELLAYWLADAVLASKFRWSIPLPLLMGQANGQGFKTGEPRRRIRPGGAGWVRAVLLGYAQAAAEACDLGAELAERAARLASVTPKLRSKAADQIVKLIFADDVVPSSRSGAHLSDRSARRLFERLCDLGAVRELSGRPSFRLYGL